MADALVSFLVQAVLGKITADVLEEIGVAWGLKNELIKLQSMLKTIQRVLHDAEMKQRTDDAVHDWLLELKDAAYDAEDILDHVAIEGRKRRESSDSGICKCHKLNVFCSLQNPLLFKFKIAHKLKSLRERLDTIADQKAKFGLGDTVVVLDNRIVDVGNREFGSVVNEADIYGRHEEKDMIIEKLTRDICDRDDLSVYVICGMGGIGKTTLAQLVYNNKGVQGHFEMRIWVSVSDDFSIKRLIKAILESTGEGGHNISELASLQRLVQERLRGKRYLLVLDDVWNEDVMLWDRLNETLMCGSKGSVMLVTTRTEKVAMMMAPMSNIHHTRCLSEEDSWSLFKGRAFATREAEESNLETIGKEIVEKCGGLPLAIKALGSLMRHKNSESEWQAVQASEIWQLPEDKTGILPALRLSYDNLSLKDRQCFAYCCIFPKDHQMFEKQLIQLWMANGFISTESQTDLPLDGHMIFKELVWRSFFQDVKRDDEGRTVCRMHDLMHDLAESVMRHETYVIENDKGIKIPKSLRHLSINSWDKLELPTGKSLRSFVVLRGHYGEYDLFISEQQYLRVLNIKSYGEMKRLWNTIYKLEHLRYLLISCQGLESLPECLTRLLNLQTLKLKDTERLRELPKDLKKMKSLCFLDIEKCLSLVCTPPGLREITCLQQLPMYIVGQDSAHQLSQLRDLNLGGHLSIKGLNHVRNFEDARSANLMMKKI